MTEVEYDQENFAHLQEEKIVSLIPELRKLLQEKHGCDDIPVRCNEFLARCLRIKDGNLEKAAKLSLCYKPNLRKLASWKVCFQPSRYIKTHYDNNIVFPLNIRHSLGRRVYMFDISKWDTNQLTATEVLVAAGMLMHYTVAHNIPDQINGLVCILDLEGLSLRQVLALRDWTLMKMSMESQNGKVGKMKAIHLINHPRVFDMLHSFLKPFLSNKIQRRIYFHRDLNSLHRNLCFDHKFLPKSLGGERETEECVDKEIVSQLVKSDDFFADMMKTGYPSK